MLAKYLRKVTTMDEVIQINLDGLIGRTAQLEDGTNYQIVGYSRTTHNIISPALYIRKSDGTIGIEFLRNVKIF